MHIGFIITEFFYLCSKIYANHLHLSGVYFRILCKVYK